MVKLHEIYNTLSETSKVQDLIDILEKRFFWMNATKMTILIDFWQKNGLGLLGIKV